MVDDYQQYYSANGHMNNFLERVLHQNKHVWYLPQSMMTEWYWSGTLMAFARVCNLRCKPDTQLETQMVANQIDE